MSSHESSFTLRYHVPRSQVWERSRGGQSGAVHLHASADVELRAMTGRCGTMTRRTGQALCGRRPWYPRPVEHESDLRIRCSDCVRLAKRYGVDWPATELAAVE